MYIASGLASEQWSCCTLVTLLPLTEPCTLFTLLLLQLVEPVLELLHGVEADKAEDEHLAPQQLIYMLRTAAHRGHAPALRLLCRLLDCKALAPQPLANLLEETLRTKNYEAAAALLSVPAVQHQTPAEAEELLLLAIGVVGDVAGGCKWEPNGLAARVAQYIALLPGVGQLGSEKLKAVLQAAVVRQAALVRWEPLIWPFIGMVSNQNSVHVQRTALDGVVKILCIT
jgi:hypothetical protein